MKKIKTALIKGTLDLSQLPVDLTTKYPTKLENKEIGNEPNKIAILDENGKFPVSLFSPSLTDKNASSIDGKNIGDNIGNIPKLDSSSKLNSSLYYEIKDNFLIENCTVDPTVSTNDPVFYDGTKWVKSIGFNIDGIYIGNNTVALSGQKIPAFNSYNVCYLNDNGTYTDKNIQLYGSVQVGYLIDDEFMIDIKKTDSKRCYNQNIIGTDYGTQLHISFGCSVAIYNNFMAVGASGKTVNTYGTQGQVYIYRYNGASWIQEQILVGSDFGTQNGIQFGYSVAIYNGVIIVGALYKDVNGYSQQGQAYVFRYNGASWIQEQILVGSDFGTQTNIGFGVSVSIHNNIIVVGASFKNVNGYSQQGQVYIYRYNGASWIQEQVLVGSDFDVQTGIYFGRSVSIYNNVIVVGAYGKNIASYSSQGQVYIFKYNGSNWVQEHILSASDRGVEVSVNFGISVSIHNNIIVVGAYYKDVNTYINQGQVYVFRYNDSSWIQEQILVGSDFDVQTGIYFGRSVSIYNNVIVVGADGKTVNTYAGQGQAYVFRHNGYSWVQEQILVGNDFGTQVGVNFGYSVAVHNNILVVGAIGKTINTYINQGQVYFFPLF